MLPHTSWPHAPTHQLSVRGTYFLTASTYNKQHHFCGAQRLDVLHRGLLRVAEEFGWRLEAWAAFSNHYHFVARGNPTSSNLGDFICALHSLSARALNELDHQPGRIVWHNFWDTRLTYQHAYLARLKYVHQNAVKHGLVDMGNKYPWCSASWFERVASTSQVKTVYCLKIDRVNVPDEF